jgi:hypothetical protein
MPAPMGYERMKSNQAFEAALRLYGRRAGRDKGSETPIYSPPDQGAVIPKKFLVQWRTRPPLGRIAVFVFDASRKELAHLENVDGDTGLLDSDELRKALSDYRAAKDSDCEARLIFKTGSGETGVNFTVMSLAHERELQRALSEVSSSHGLFQYVERATIFDSFKMYDKVAAEYDEALREAPSSHDMVQASLDAHAKIGDLRRAKELRDKLRELEAARKKN